MVRSKDSIPVKKKHVKSAQRPSTNSPSSLSAVAKRKTTKAKAPKSRKSAGKRNPPPSRKRASATSSSSSNRKRKANDAILQNGTKSMPRVARPVTIQQDAAGVYGPMIRLKQKRQLDTEIPIVPLPPRIIGGLRDQLEKAKHCNCKRSHCLKLYCECFASGIHCSPLCNCVSCHNNEASDERHRNDAVLSTLDRNPHAFRPRVIAIAGAAASISRDAQTASLSREDTTVEPPHSMIGCNCRKSFCLKKYCECFQAAVYCNPPHCKCKLCQNVQGNPTRERLVAKRRSQAEAAAAAAALAHQHSRLGHMSGRMAIMGDTRRSYYGVDHTGSHRNASTPEPGNTTGVEATKAAQAAAASAAAGGVDVFLPPSSYTVPLQVHGTPYVGVSFGSVGKKLEESTKHRELAAGQPPQDQALPPTDPMSSNEPIKRCPNHFPAETCLERFWREEAEKADKLFKTIHDTVRVTKIGTDPSEVQIREMESWKTNAESLPLQEKQAPTHSENQTNPDNRISPTSTAQSLSEPTRAEKALQSTRGDVEKLVAAAVKAEKATILRMDSQNIGSSHYHEEETRNEISNRNISILDTNGAGVTDDSLLTCHEEIDSSSQELSSFAMRELTILATQDAAMLRELTQIIRQKTLDLGMVRKLCATKNDT